MTTSDAGATFIKQFEGFNPSAYQDQRGIPTIGYGHTLGVKLGDTCTQAQADQWLVDDLANTEGAVNKYVRPVLSQNQFDALVSLTFNIGSGNFLQSTVLKRLNLTQPADYAGAAEAILMWNRTNGEVNPGLQRRREAEKDLFLTPPVLL